MQRFGQSVSAGLEAGLERSVERLLRAESIGRRMRVRPTLDVRRIEKAGAAEHAELGICRLGVTVVDMRNAMAAAAVIRALRVCIVPAFISKHGCQAMNAASQAALGDASAPCEIVI
jgi:hypothetical protein